MMYKDISSLDVESRDGMASLERQHRWCYDRTDIYRARGEQYSPDTMGIRIFYELYEANCNPDFDW